VSAQAVHDAISARVSGLGYPVQWAGSVQQQQSAPEFLRLAVTPLTRRLPMLDDDSPAIVTGLIVVDCFAASGAGMSRAHEIGDDVAAAFGRASRIHLPDGQIIEFADGGLVTGAWAAADHTHVEVQIGYKVYG